MNVQGYCFIDSLLIALMISQGRTSWETVFGSLNRQKPDGRWPSGLIRLCHRSEHYGRARAHIRPWLGRGATAVGNKQLAIENIT